MQRLESEFWKRVNKTETCWLWTGAKCPSRRSQPIGYGKLQVNKNPVRHIYAHRLSWMIHFGSISKGKKVLHRCDNPPCVNPAHLFLGTQVDNMKDCKQKGRNASGARHGRTRITDKEVLDIRRRVADGESTRSVARLYGMGKSTIWQISARINWRHIE